MPKLLAVPDKFRGTLTAPEAAHAIAHAAQGAGWECELAPVSDGGEGFLDVFSGLGAARTARVSGPLGDEVQVPWILGRDPDDPGRPVAYMESALAIGLGVIGGPTANDAVRASSAGLGQLVAAAVKAGAGQVVIGVGGSATTDGGLGAVDVLAPFGRAPNAEVVVACDVETRFLDAAAVFSPQKGATPAQSRFLGRRLERLAQVYADRFGVDVRELVGGGAAGGLAGGLAAIGAKLVPGFDLVADKLALAERVAGADLVVTGEGHLDEQSFAGKAVGGVARLAAAAGVPVLIVAGDGHLAAGTATDDLAYISLVERFGPDRAWSAAGPCVSQAVAEWLARSAGR